MDNGHISGGSIIFTAFDISWCERGVQVTQWRTGERSISPDGSKDSFPPNISGVNEVSRDVLNSSPTDQNVIHVYGHTLVIPN